MVMQHIRIGRALLLHGDCRDLTVAGLFTEAHAILTDPPYGIGYKVSARSNRGRGLVATKPMAQGITPEALRIHRQKWRGVVREGEENCRIAAEFGEEAAA